MADSKKDVELQKAATDVSQAKDTGEKVVDQEEEERLAKENFVPSHGLTTAEADALLLVHGKNELEEKTVPKWLIFLKMLWGPMPCMIWLAIIVELAIENWLDAGILLGIQFANATIGWYETTKAGDAVAALKASLKPVATVKRDGKWQNINATLLVPGDLVLLAAGSAVPADARVNSGQVQADQSAMTGESLPVSKYAKDLCFMGSTITRGETEGTVAYTGKLTFFGKTATMLNQGDTLGNLQKVLLKIMGVLVVMSLTLCAITLIYLTVHKEIDFKEALSFTVVLLVASIPIAIEIVCTATLALGSRQLSAHGAIVTRLVAIEEMAGMNMLCSDKTGTLTLNKMVIQEDCPTYSPGMNLQAVLQNAAMAAKWKEPARDALDTMVLGAAKLDELEAYTQTDFSPFDPTIKRTEGTIKGPDGKVFKVTKGAPNIIAGLCEVDKERVAKEVDWKVQELATRGIRSLAVARTNDQGKWIMLGLLTFLDPPRPDTKRTIERAIEYGVDVKMITGDHTVIAKEMARTLGMGDNIKNAKGLPSMPADGSIPKDLGKKYASMILAADGFAQVYPEHKFLIVEALRQEGFACGMTGDGVNDAPALKRADVGIAVQGSTDAARAAADIVLTQPGLGVVVEAIVIARMIFQRIKNFINYRIAATLQLLIFFFIAVFVFDPLHYWGKQDSSKKFEKEWPEFFSLPVLMLMLITLLNDGTLISVGYDFVSPSPRPEKWNLRALFVISAVLGGVACVSSLLLLWGALDSHNPDGMFAAFKLPTLEYGKITTLIYLKVSLSDFLTLFSARTHSEFFWARKPSPILLGAAGLALAISTILASVWPDGETDGIHVKGLCLGGETKNKLWPLWVWLYCIVWWFIQDAVKVATYWVMVKYDVFQIRTAGLVNLRDAARVNDPAHPLARESVGVMETKNLENKVANAISHVNELARNSGGNPTLARVSQKLALTRVSGAGKASRADVEGGVHDAENAITEIEEAVESDPAQRAALQAPLAELKDATAKLAETKQALK